MSEFGDFSELVSLVNWDEVAVDVIKKHRRRRAEENADSRKETGVKALYSVYVVDAKTGEILVDGRSVIAKSEESSKFAVVRSLERDDVEDLVVRSQQLFSIPSRDDLP